MITIDLPEDDKALSDELANKFPEEIEVIEGRAIDGTLTHWTLFISAAAILIPEVRKIVVELIRLKRHKSVTFKGKKIQGYSHKEVATIIAAIDEAGGKR